MKSVVECYVGGYDVPVIACAVDRAVHNRRRSREQFKKSKHTKAVALTERQTVTVARTV